MESAKRNGIECWDGTLQVPMWNTAHGGGFLTPLWAQFRRQWEDTRVLGKECTKTTCVMGIGGKVEADCIFRHGNEGDSGQGRGQREEVKTTPEPPEPPNKAKCMKS